MECLLCLGDEPDWSTDDKSRKPQAARVRRVNPQIDPKKEHSHTGYDTPIKQNQILFLPHSNFPAILPQSSPILHQFFNKFFAPPSPTHATWYLCLLAYPALCYPPVGLQISGTYVFVPNLHQNQDLTRGLHLCQESKSCPEHAKGQFNRLDCRSSPQLSTTISITNVSISNVAIDFSTSTPSSLFYVYICIYTLSRHFIARQDRDKRVVDSPTNCRSRPLIARSLVASRRHEKVI